MAAVRLLALDLDGTLLDARSRLQAGALPALAAAAARGVTLAVVTGRSAGSAHHFARQVAAATGARMPFVACNGAGVYSPEGRLEAHMAIPHPLLGPCLGALQGAGLLVSCYTRHLLMVDRPWRHFRAFWSPHRPAPRSWPRVVGATWQFYRTNRVTPVRDLRRWVEQRQEPVLKVFAVCPGADRAPLQAAAQALAQGLPGLHVTRSAADNLEVTAPGVHKAWGLRVLAEMLRVPRETVMAIGDGPNDVEMLEWAGTGVAMGNAPDWVQARVGRVAPPFAEEGVAAAVRQYILREEA